MFRIFVYAAILLSCNGHKNETSIYPVDSIKNKVIDTSTLEINAAQLIEKNFKHQEISLNQVFVKLSGGDSFYLQIPLNYQLSVAAEGLGRLRFLAISQGGRLFATDMYDRSDNHKGRVLLFDEWNDTIKKFRTVKVFIDSLHNPNQVAFYKGFMYVAETDRLSRYVYSDSKDHPLDTGQVIMTFPAYGLGYKYGGWHLTRSLAFHNNKLYVSVGSSCNACVETEEIRATVIEMDPGGGNVKYFARGLRNTVGLKWIGNELWGTGMGRDLIGPDKPEDTFQKIDSNGYYGWPYYFQYHQNIYEDDQFKDSGKSAWVKKPPIAYLGFKAHSAPLGFDHFKNFNDMGLNNSILVCLHGSTSVWRERGNSIVKVEADNKYSAVISGFLTGKTEAGRHGRPCDILMKDDHSFFFTDDLNGVLYFVWK
ncbi:MAG: hypothetical protein ABIO04_02605 [Ferruginibacter sp.]